MEIWNFTKCVEMWCNSRLWSKKLFWEVSLSLKTQREKVGINRAFRQGVEVNTGNIKETNIFFQTTRTPAETKCLQRPAFNEETHFLGFVRQWERKESCLRFIFSNVFRGSQFPLGMKDWKRLKRPFLFNFGRSLKRLTKGLENLIS